MLRTEPQGYRAGFSSGDGSTGVIVAIGGMPVTTSPAYLVAT